MVTSDTGQVYPSYHDTVSNCRTKQDNKNAKKIPNQQVLGIKIQIQQFLKCVPKGGENGQAL